MPDFSKANVGDVVYHITKGYGTIVKILGKRIWTDTAGPFFDDGTIIEEDENPSVFWSKPEISDPPPPKRKVKKVVEGYLNIYPKNDEIYFHRSKQQAESAINAGGTTIEATLTYEIEE